ncbi:hypothetical protein ADK43_14865 [Streptomyces rimosus subsp. rimosus]|nr:hypothetical protein ADK43_14865 [Streptomyces rimosus subsp. rimosus]
MPVARLLAAHILTQRPAQSDVDDLKSTAEGQQRQPARQRVPRHREIERVLLGVHVVDPLVDLGAGVVELRRHIAATRQ